MSSLRRVVVGVEEEEEEESTLRSLLGIRGFAIAMPRINATPLKHTKLNTAPSRMTRIAALVPMVETLRMKIHNHNMVTTRFVSVHIRSL